MKWMRWGRKSGGKAHYVHFFQEITKAIGEARSDAEHRVFTKEPYNWLRSGPGKRDWGDRAQLEISGGDRPLRIEDSRPAPVTHLAQAYLIFQQLGIMPTTDEKGQALIASFANVSDSEEGEGNGEGVGGVPAVLTAMPEWMRRTPSQGRKRGGKQSKKKKKEGDGDKSPPAIL